MKDGEYKMIPVEECEFGCAVGAMCGNETECAIGSVVIYVVLSVFGCFFITFVTIFCCCVCRAAAEGRKEHIHEPLIEKKKKHKDSSSSDESDKEKKAKKYNPEA